jgi:hypothetical protein
MDMLIFNFHCSLKPLLPINTEQRLIMLTFLELNEDLGVCIIIIFFHLIIYPKLQAPAQLSPRATVKETLFQTPITAE